MNPVPVKICGITNLDDALRCAGEGAAYLGFIFTAKSPRFVSPETAASIIRRLPENVTPVGVFVNAPREYIRRIISIAGIRLLQLSGDELPHECGGFLQPVWKSFRIREPEAVGITAWYPVEAAMLDGARDGDYGGSGIAADPNIALAIKKYHRLVLAGGLNPDNIVAAIRDVAPFVVDVNSGVESSPGKKDPDKITKLFRNIASYEHSDSSKETTC